MKNIRDCWCPMYRYNYIGSNESTNRPTYKESPNCIGSECGVWSPVSSTTGRCGLTSNGQLMTESEDSGVIEDEDSDICFVSIDECESFCKIYDRCAFVKKMIKKNKKK